MSKVLVGTDECLLFFRGQTGEGLALSHVPQIHLLSLRQSLSGSGLLDSPALALRPMGFHCEFDCTVIGASGRGAIDGDAVARLQAKTVIFRRHACDGRIS